MKLFNPNDICDLGRRALTCLSAAGKANAACNVCWQWSLTGSLTGYYKGTNCAVVSIVAMEIWMGCIITTCPLD